MAKDLISQDPLDSVQPAQFDVPALSLPKREFISPPQAKVSKADLQSAFFAAAQKYDVPFNILMGLAEQESNFDPVAINKDTGAKGIMQYMDATAKSAGIDPFDPIQSIDFAAKQLSDRLKNGYSMDDAVKEHFAGPDRKLWGKKTSAYGDEVLQRAIRFADELDPQPQSDSQPATTMEQIQLSPLTISGQEEMRNFNGLPPLNKPASNFAGEFNRLPKEPELDGIISANKKALQNVIPDFKIAFGGYLRSAMDGSDDRNLYYKALGMGLLDRLQQEGVVTFKDGGGLSGAKEPVFSDGTLVDEASMSSFLRANAGKYFSPEEQANLAGLKQSDMAKFAEDYARNATKELKPINPDGTIAKYSSMTIGAAAEMAPMLLTAALTRNPAAAAAMMNAQVGGTSYNRAVDDPNHPLSHTQARQYASAQALAEAIPEMWAVGKIMGAGGSLLRRLATSMGVESGQEGVTGAIQAGLDKQTITPDMTWGEARQQIIDSMVVGAAMGPAMHGTMRGSEIVTDKAKNLIQSDGRKIGNILHEDVNNTRFTPYDASRLLDPNQNTVPITPRHTPISDAVNRVAQADPTPAATQQPTEQQPSEQPQYDFSDGDDVHVSFGGDENTPAKVESITPDGVMVQVDGESYLLPHDEISVGNVQITHAESKADIRARELFNEDAIAEREQEQADLQSADEVQAQLWRDIQSHSNELEDLDHHEDNGIPENVTPDESNQPDATQANDRRIEVREDRAGRNDPDPQESMADLRNAEPDTNAVTEPAKPLIKEFIGADGNLKWFGSKPKALEFIAKKGAEATHHVVKNGAKWEIKAIPAPVTDGSNIVSMDDKAPSHTFSESEQNEKADKAQPSDLAIQQASQDDNAKQHQRMAEMVQDGTISLDDANKITERAIRAANIASDNSVAGDYMQEYMDRITGNERANRLISTIDRFENGSRTSVGDLTPPTIDEIHNGKLSGMTVRQARSHLRELDNQSAQQAGKPAVTDEKPQTSTEKLKAIRTRYQQQGAKAIGGERGDHIKITGDAGYAGNGTYKIEGFTATGDIHVTNIETGGSTTISKDAIAGYQRKGTTFENVSKQQPVTEQTGTPTPTAEIKSESAPDALNSDQVAEKEKPAKKAVTASDNKIFTEDAAEKARQLLRSKLGQLNSGIDPEILQAGIMLSGYHIEKGARTFAAYAKAMLEDLGEISRPYLKSWYLGVKFDPRAATFDGMDGAGQVESFDLSGVGSNEIRNEPTQTTSATSDRTLAGVSTEPVQETKGQRDTQSGSPTSSRDDAGRNGDTGRAGDASGSGMGDGARTVPIQTGRSRSQRRSAGQSGVQTESRSQSNDEPTVAESKSESVAAAKVATDSATDYRITADTRLGEGGQKTKFKNNIEAIRLLNSLSDHNWQSLASDQDVLARYVGWGGLSQAFDENNATWAKEYQELKSLLTPDEWNEAKESTQYAHYTADKVITGMYDALNHMGFNGGRIIEAGAGVGNFMGLMPEHMRGNSRFTAVERERIAGGIAKALYPNQNVQLQDFRSFNAPDGHFDAAIGNPPFSSTTLTDLSGRKHLSGLSIHNYFFAKNVDLLRDGGVMAMVVSNSFMDAKGDKARRYIGERTKLLGAIRLPNNAFSKNANTEVTTDIVFLQKLPESEWAGRAAKEDAKRWMGLSYVADPLGGEDIPVNQYFADNPHMMLGTMARSGSMYRKGSPTLTAIDGADLSEQLNKAIQSLPKDTYQAVVKANNAQLVDSQIVALHDNTNVSVGGHYLNDGKLFVRLDDIAGEGRAIAVTATTKISEKRDLGAKGLDRIKSLVGIRNTLRELLSAELSNDSSMENLRKALNQQYDAFVKEHGLINSRATVQAFGDDPDFPLIASLEHNYDAGIGAAAAKAQGIKPVAAKAKKSPIFTERVIQSHQEITKADSPQDALMISIAERGQIDAGYIGELLSRDGAEVLDELTKGDKPSLFIDPATNGYVLRDAYLSGNVRKKYKQAKAAGMFKNVAELEAVLPADIPAHEISAKVGSPWVPESIYEEFAKHLFGDGTVAKVVYVPALSNYVTHFKAGSDVHNRNTFGTSKIDGVDILSSLLNSKEIKVGSYVKDAQGNQTFVLDKEGTDEANDKAREIKDKFEDWLFADAERSDNMQRAYNDAVNNYVNRKYDGSMIKFIGKVPDTILKMRRHQRNAVARITQDGRALLDHVVGAGKTFTVIASAMELKRTGLAQKPMIAVPNHLVKQWAADFYRLYPSANILTATKKDFERANRRKFLAKIATGNWDAVIIAHSSFGFIKPDAEFEQKFNRDRVTEIVEAIAALKEAGGSEASRTIKQLAKMEESLENKLAALRDKPMDDLLDFGQLGVDQLYVDEAHMFKNLMYVTKMQNVRGLGNAKGSQKAYDMFIKTHQLYEKNGGGRGVVFATGTPISNSLAEMYHMLRYLAPETLKDSGQFTFDAWAKTYADIEQVWMQSLSGNGYKSTNRMSKFVNTPELLKVFDQVADTVTIEDIKKAYAEENNGKEFPIPKLKGGRRTPVSIPISAEQSDYMAEIADRAKEMESRKGKPEKGADNMLSIMGDARKAAMDIRLVRKDIIERDPNGRIAITANNIYDRYQKYNAVKGTQLVFSDMGMPKKQAEKALKEYNELTEQAAPLQDEAIRAMADLGDEAAISQLDKAEAAQAKIDANGADWLSAIEDAKRGFSIYDDLRKALVEKGIPEHEVAFIHDYNTDDQKAALFKSVNEGRVRVLLGSTAKMGAGTNVQERLVAEHHMDVPWKPSDIEQREGRIIRQGNKLLDELPDFEVEVMAYATQDTLDLFMWQTQEKKLAMINQLREGGMGREVDDAFEDLQLSAGEMQAAATSNPYLMEEIQIKDKIKRLERQKKSFDGQKNDLINRKRKAEKELLTLPERIATAKTYEREANVIIEANDRYFNSLTATVNGVTIKGADEIRAAVKDAIHQSPEVEKDGKKTRQVSVDINGKTYTSESGAAEAILKTIGDASKVVLQTADGTTVNRSGDFANAMAGVIANLSTKPQMVGSIGKFDINVSIHQDHLMVDLSLSGEEVGGYSQYIGKADGSSLMSIARAIPSSVLRQVDNLIGSVDYLNAEKARYERSLNEVSGTSLDGAWSGDADLKAARERHKEILRKLSEKDASDELEAELEAESAAEEVDGNETSEDKNDTSERYSIADTIEVDGKQRPVTNSNGQPIHGTREGIRNFWRWFGDSKVVDEQGRPLVAYHGTPADISVFEPTRAGEHGARFADAVFFSSDSAVAGAYSIRLKSSEAVASYQAEWDKLAEQRANIVKAGGIRSEQFNAIRGEMDDIAAKQKAARMNVLNYSAPSKGANVIPAYLRIKDPFVVDGKGKYWSEVNGEAISRAISNGHDGVFITNVIDSASEKTSYPADVYVVFSPEQIKSAIGNDGYFSGETSDIRYSMGAADGDLIGDQLIRSLVDSGKIVIHDTTDTLPSQRKAGVAGFTAADGTIHVVGNNLSVVLHEAFHSGGKALLGDKRWQNLISRLESMHKAAKSGDGFWKGAADRVAHAGVTGKLAAEEFGAYAIENYDRAPSGVKKWVESIVGAVQAWLYRRFGIQAGKVTAAQLRSLAKAAIKTVGVDVNNVSPTEHEIEGWFSRQLTNRMPQLLKTAPLDRLIDEIGRNIPALQTYLKLKRGMDTYRNQKHTTYDAIAQRWLSFAVKHPNHANTLAYVMHRSTIDQVDPTKNYESSVNEHDLDVALNQVGGKAAREAAERIAEDKKRQADYGDVKALYATLPNEAKDLYRTVRDAYIAQTKEVDQIILANMEKAMDVQANRAVRKHAERLQQISDDGLKGDEKDEAIAKADKALKTAQTKAKFNKAARMLKMRQAFESNRLKGPYFPLSRFGDFFVTVRDSSGEVINFSRFNDAKSQQTFAAEMAKEKGYAVEKGYMYEHDKIRKAVDAGFVADIEDIMSEAGAPTEVMDQVWQRYLDTLPDLNIRKKFKHRKGREGYHADALKAFSSHMFHAAHQMGRMKFSMDMTETLEQAKHEAQKDKKQTRSQMLVNEIERRNQYVMNPVGAAWAQRLTGAAFFWYLGLNPASALVNVSQTVIIGAPVLGAAYGKNGVTIALAEIAKASKDFAMGKGHIANANVSADEHAAMNHAYEIGLIDKTQGHDLAGVGENGVEYNALRNRAMGYVSSMFHQAERFNREVTFLAAYRMAKRKGMTGDTAHEWAGNLTWKSHFDYANTNRPSFMHGDIAKVLLVFRNYQVNMLFRLFRDLHQATAGETKELRQEALKQFGAITGMMALNAGIKGVWLTGIAKVIASLFFGDDDPEEELTKGMYKYLPATLASIALNGVVGTAFGIDVTNRIGMPDLWFRSPDRELEGKEEYAFYLAQMAGAIPAIGQSWLQGYKMAKDGNIERGIETAAPVFIRNAMKTARYAMEGATTMNGDPIIQTDYKDVIRQALGFTPMKVTERYETNNAAMNKQTRIADEKSSLVNRWVKAKIAKDADALAEVKAEIKQFTANNRDTPIKMQTLMNALRGTKRAHKETQGGLRLRGRLGKRIREDAAPEYFNEED